MTVSKEDAQRALDAINNWKTHGEDGAISFGMYVLPELATITTLLEQAAK